MSTSGSITANFTSPMRSMSAYTASFCGSSISTTEVSFSSASRASVRTQACSREAFCGSSSSPSETAISGRPEESSSTSSASSAFSMRRAESMIIRSSSSDLIVEKMAFVMSLNLRFSRARSTTANSSFISKGLCR
ncbi:MAG: hypothetical protein A3J79_13865 [Elusimicrobia bacterium RIFOXYB2_FULL_62_6]|nr:MAG: hypothetical protein A3J79_13865 [Elusimicrobia bacterium RIFOXYB2_FULL_62_6]